MFLRLSFCFGLNYSVEVAKFQLQTSLRGNSHSLRNYIMKTVFFLIKRKVLSYYVHIGSLRDFTRSIEVLNKQNRPSSILLVNPTVLQKGTQDAQLEEALQSADILIPKGILMQKSLRWLYNSDSERFSAEVLLESVIRDLELNSFFFLGKVEALGKLSKKYPDVLIKPVDEKEVKGLNSEISISGERLLVVCLPSGEQEKWIEELKGSVNACMLGLGDMYYSPSFFKKLLNDVAFFFKVLRQKMVYS